MTIDVTQLGAASLEDMIHLDDIIHALFQEYHLANYHDGDDTFASTIFDTNSDEEYSNEFVRDCFEHFYHSAKILVKLGGAALCDKLIYLK